MNNDERRKLDDIHDALFSVPVGSPPDTKPLLQQIRGNMKLIEDVGEDTVRAMAGAWNKGSWFIRLIVYGAPVLVACVVAFEWIISRVSGKGS